MNINIIKFFDKYVGNVLCFFLSFFNKEVEIKNIKNILILQFWGIGETILTLPAVRALREKFPKAKIYVLATSRNADVYYENKDIDNFGKLGLNVFSILSFVISNYKKFDLVVDMEEYLNISTILSFFAGKTRIGFNGRARGKLYTKSTFYNDKQHTVDTFMDLVRLVGAEIKVEKLISLNYSKKDKKAVDDFLEEKGINKNDFVVGVVPGAAESAKSRMWSKDKYAEFNDLLVYKHKAKIVMIGNTAEHKLIREIRKLMDNDAVNTAGAFTVRELFYLVERCKVVISNDTGPMHIAAAQGIKTIGIFGPNTPIRWAPYGNNVAIYKNVFCSPCIHTHLGIVPECKWPKNNKYYLHCMRNISVDNVMKGFEDIIKR